MFKQKGIPGSLFERDAELPCNASLVAGLTEESVMVDRVLVSIPFVGGLGADGITTVGVIIAGRTVK